jgi:hypothetical protein
MSLALLGGAIEQEKIMEVLEILQSAKTADDLSGLLSGITLRTTA